MAATLQPDGFCRAGSWPQTRWEYTAFCLPARRGL